LVREAGLIKPAEGASREVSGVVECTRSLELIGYVLVVLIGEQACFALPEPGSERRGIARREITARRSKLIVNLVGDIAIYRVEGGPKSWCIPRIEIPPHEVGCDRRA
jgi:hypothetical protein